MVTATAVLSHDYDFVIKGGQVIDIKNDIDEMMDLAIKGDKIAEVQKNIDSNNAKQVVKANGAYITPGLIDIHTHNFYGTHMNQAPMHCPRMDSLFEVGYDRSRCRKFRVAHNFRF